MKEFLEEVAGDLRALAEYLENCADSWTPRQLEKYFDARRKHGIKLRLGHLRYNIGLPKDRK